MIECLKSRLNLKLFFSSQSNDNLELEMYLLKLINSALLLLSYHQIILFK